MAKIIPDYWSNLGLPLEADERSIKRAYAQRLKLLDPAVQTEAFAQLRADYELALRHVREGWQFYELAIEEDVEQDTSVLPEIETPAIQIEPVVQSEQPTKPEVDTAIAEASLSGEPKEKDTAPSDKLLHEPDAIIDPQLAARLSHENFRAALSDIGLIELKRIRVTLEHALTIEGMNGLTSRDEFERLVVQGVVDRGYGRHTGAVFFAALSVFQWDQLGDRQFQQFGVAAWALIRYVDAASLLNESEQNTWSWLAYKPHAVHLPFMKNFDAKFGLDSALAALFCNEGEWQEWHALLEVAAVEPEAVNFNLPEKKLPGKAKNKTLPSWRIDYGVIAPFATVIGILVGLYLVFSSLGNKQQAQAFTRCDQVMSSIMEQKWRDVSDDNLREALQCSFARPPIMCSDRDALQSLAVTYGRLRHGTLHALKEGSYLSYGLPDQFLFHTSSGLSFQLKEGVCPYSTELLDSGRWLDMEDAKATARYALHMKACLTSGKTANNSYSHESPQSSFATRILENLDIETTDRRLSTTRQTATIALSSLTRPVKIALTDRVIYPNKPWPQCAANQSDLMARIITKESDFNRYNLEVSVLMRRLGILPSETDANQVKHPLLDLPKSSTSPSSPAWVANNSSSAAAAATAAAAAATAAAAAAAAAAADAAMAPRRASSATQ
jgi:hypothetical protein